MASSYQDQMLIGAPVKSLAALGRRRLDSAAKLMIEEYDCSKTLKQYNGKDRSFRNRIRRKADGFARGFREHMSLGPKMNKIWKVGGLKKLYEKKFRMNKGEEVLKASHCYLSTTAGQIAGLLFISTHNIAFCSHKSIKFSSPNGDHHFTFHYKVVIPVEKVMGVNQSVNVKKASQKYIQIVTVDNFEFWFMDFLNYHSTFKCLQELVRRL